VIGIPSERWGEKVHAIVVARPGSDGNPWRVDGVLQDADRGLQMPAQRRGDGGPAAPSGAGKILKRKLRNPYWEKRQRMVS
jgi:long-chain acyl-CoA synthetase